MSQLITNMKITNKMFTFSFFTFTIYFELDKPHFTCSITTWDYWLSFRQERIM